MVLQGHSLNINVITDSSDLSMSDYVDELEDWILFKVKKGENIWEGG